MSTSFDELMSVMARLRAPGGCPWDREQTYGSLAQYLLEEAYETFDAIHEAEATGETANLKEELGDLLLQVAFHSTIAAEKGDFTMDEVADGVAQKLILRHPHVFGDTKLEHAKDVLDNWDTLKENERKASGKVVKQHESVLDEVTVHFPALLEALKISSKAAKIGFDWKDINGIFDKLDEEVVELKAAIEKGDTSETDEEIGDLLFVIVNLARRLDIEPESALKRSNRKFRRRFRFVEKELESAGKKVGESGLDEMDALWNIAKAN